MKGEIKSYRDLIIWQKSMSLVGEIYKSTKSFPSDEIYGLSSQLRRCAVSIPSNIAEGYGRNSTQDYIRFLNISTGAVYELQTQLEISFNLGYINGETFYKLYESTKGIGKDHQCPYKKTY